MKLSNIVVVICLIAIIAQVPTWHGTCMAVTTTTGVSPEVQKWYNTVEKLPAGSRILVDYAVSEDVEPEIGPFAVAVFHHVFRRDSLKTVFVSTAKTQSVALWEAAMREVNPEACGRKYGEDYVMLGYFPGCETAMAALGRNIEGLTTTDYKGGKLNQLPVMRGITGFLDKNAKVFALLMCFTAAIDIAEGWVRQWYTPYKTPYLCCVSAAKLQASMLPYMKAGQIVSVTTGKQSVEYEQLIGRPGRGTQAAQNRAMMETLTTVVLPIIGVAVCVLVAAIALRLIRYKRRRAKLDFYLEEKRNA